MSFNTKRVGQRQYDGRAVAGRNINRFSCQRRPFGQIPDVTFDEHGFGRTKGLGSDIADGQFHAGAEVSLHCALPVRADKNMAAGSRRSVGSGFKPYIDAERTHIVIKNRTQLILLDAADICGRPTQVGEASHGIGNGSARHFCRRTHQ